MWITSAHKKDGFTLIELLVVIAIIGILSTVASVSLIQARRRARDTKRVSDIQQLRNALLIYSNQRADYPAGDALVLGRDSAKCLDDAGFGEVCDPADGRLIIMARVPVEQFVSATQPEYRYTYEDTVNYRMEFRLEGEVGDLPGGSCTARPDGVTCAP